MAEKDQENEQELDLNKEVIVKVQMSLNSSDDVERALIYNESREIFYETEDENDIKEIKKLIGDEVKLYCVAGFVHDGKEGFRIQLRSIAKPQNW